MNEVYHKIETEDNTILYSVITGELFSVPVDVAKIVVDYYNIGKSIDEICLKEGFDSSYVREVVKEYNVAITYSKRQSDKESKVSFGWSVNLHVSHECNLSCSYCLVDSDYGKPIIMTEEILDASLDYLTSKVGNIETITFYGGEPTLNIPAIKRTVQFFKKCHDNETISKVPNYSLITNGTNIDQEFAAFLATNRISVGVSIDGMKSVHDANRVTNSGHGTHSEVVKSIALLIENNADVTFSSVFTPEHQRRSIHVDGILEYLRKETKLAVGNVSPAINVFSWQELLDYNTDEMLEYIEDHLTSVPVSKVWLNAALQNFISGQGIETVCPGGLQNFAIDPLGDIFPCQGFVGKREYKIGSVFDPIPFPLTIGYKTTLNEIQNVASVRRNPKCSICWARNLCNFCPLVSETYFGTLQPPSEYCERLSAGFEQILGKLADVFSDEEQKMRFVANFKKRLDQLLYSPQSAQMPQMP